MFYVFQINQDSLLSNLVDSTSERPTNKGIKKSSQASPTTLDQPTLTITFLSKFDKHKDAVKYINSPDIIQKCLNGNSVSELILLNSSEIYILHKVFPEALPAFQDLNSSDPANTRKTTKKVNQTKIKSLKKIITK